MKTGIFITGTNTGIGKTFISSALLCALQQQQALPYYFKPVQTGDDLDSETVQKLTNLPSGHIIPPAYTFAAPKSPYEAAQIQKHPGVDFGKIAAVWAQRPPGHFVVEGAGGLLVPLTQQLFIRDLIVLLQLPIIIVASQQLGTLNHTLLTLEAAAKANIVVKGIVLCGEHVPGLREILKNFITVPILAEVPGYPSVSPETVRQAANEFDRSVLAEIFT